MTVNYCCNDLELVYALYLARLSGTKCLEERASASVCPSNFCILCLPNAPETRVDRSTNRTCFALFNLESHCLNIALWALAHSVGQRTKRKIYKAGTERFPRLRIENCDDIFTAMQSLQQRIFGIAFSALMPAIK